MKSGRGLADLNGRVMKAALTTAEMTTFGEFVVAFYDAWSEPDAAVMVSLALDAGLVVFRRPGWSRRLPVRTRVEIAALLRERFASLN